VKELSRQKKKKKWRQRKSWTDDRADYITKSYSGNGTRVDIREKKK
jgi:hypothetical protein